MPIMTEHAGEVIGGVDTHGEVHHAAVIDTLGRHLADREFPATGAGYRSLECWLRSHGTVVAVGVEGTGAYGAELTRSLARSGLRVVEVDRPDRKTRRMRGKSDPIDAYAAATAVASGRATGTPKQREGIVETNRALRVPLRSAVKARTQAINQARQLLVTDPEALRASLRDRTWLDLARACAQLRPVDLSDPRQATKAASLPGDVVGPLVARWLGVRGVVTAVSSNTLGTRMRDFGRADGTRIGSPFTTEAMTSLACELTLVAGYESNGGFLLLDDVDHARETLLTRVTHGSRSSLWKHSRRLSASTCMVRNLTLLKVSPWGPRQGGR